MTLEDKKNKLIEDFNLFDDWMDRYDYLIELGKNLAPLDEQYKTEKYRIYGCQSDVWLHAKFENGKVWFEADSNAIITKGLMSLLIYVYNGEPPEIVEKADMEFITQIGLSEQLTPSRANGLASMLKQIKVYAHSFNKQLK